MLEPLWLIKMRMIHLSQDIKQVDGYMNHGKILLSSHRPAIACSCRERYHANDDGLSPTALTVSSKPV